MYILQGRFEGHLLLTLEGNVSRLQNFIDSPKFKAFADDT